MSKHLPIYQSPIKFRQVLPSSLTILLLGATVFFFNPTWTWFGELGVNAITLGCVLGLALYALAYFLTCSTWFMSPSMKLLLETLHTLFGRFTWPQILLISTLAGVGEELLMRGLIQAWLQAQFNPMVAIFIASLIFGLMHFMNLTYVLLTFVGGLILGTAFYFSDSLALVVVAHGVYDVCAFTMIVKFPHMLGLKSVDDFDDEKSDLKE